MNTSGSSLPMLVGGAAISAASLALLYVNQQKVKAFLDYVWEGDVQGAVREVSDGG